MKKTLFSFYLLLLTFSLTSSSFSQSYKLQKIGNADFNPTFPRVEDASGNNPVEFDGPNPPGTSAANITVLNGTGPSTFGRAPQSSTRYQRCYYFISAQEMKLSGFPSGSSITTLGFNYSIATSGSVADTFKVYFENGPSVFADKGSNWFTATTPMTLVSQGPMTIPSAPGTVDYTLTNPGAFTYTGGGLWVAFEYQNIAGALGTANTALCNTALPAPALRNMAAGSNTALATTMTSSSNFRPVTRLGTPFNDYLVVRQVYAYGEKIISCIDTNFYTTYFTHLRSGIDTVNFKYVIKNVASNFVKDSVSFTVILNDTGATTNYTVTVPFLKTDSLKADSVIVTATLSSDEITGNNKARTQTTTALNTINHAITGSANTGGAGFTSAGFELAMAHDAGDCPIYLNRLNYLFGTTGQNYEIRVYAGDNGNVPGTLLYFSGNLVNTTGANSHTLSSPLALPPGKFFVSFRQITATNFSLQYQAELPIRPLIYYTGNPGNWSSSSSGFKYNVQLVTTVNLDLTLRMEGFFNGTSMVGDTVDVNLRLQTPPYTIVDNATAYVNSAGNGVFKFDNASPNTCYYYEVIHRNHIRTFSHSTCEQLNANTTSYDFSSASSQALGNNLIFVSSDSRGGGWSTYTSDVNQDDVVDLTDCSDVDNDAFNFLGGYIVTDVNGDGVVDLTDLSFCDNNAANFVSAITP